MNKETDFQIFNSTLGAIPDTTSFFYELLNTDNKPEDVIKEYTKLVINECSRKALDKNDKNEILLLKDKLK